MHVVLSELNGMGYWSLDGVWEDRYGGTECVVLYFIASLAGASVSTLQCGFFGKLSHAAATRRIRFVTAIRIWDSILRLE